MGESSAFYGFGTMARYVTFFGRRGVVVRDIAEALGRTVWQLVAECPDVDVLQYPVYEDSPHVWTNEEVRALMVHYPLHGAEWPKWAEILPGRTVNAIRGHAKALGIPRGRRVNGPCGLCQYARPIYDQSTRQLVLDEKGRAVLACVLDLDDALPMVFADTDARREFDQRCFTPYPAQLV